MADTADKEFQEFVQGAFRDTRYTPDLPIIQLQTHQDIFVYGTLKKGFSNDASLGRHKLALGVGWTQSDRFSMFRTTDLKENYPIILPTHSTDLRGHIYGEVYRVPSDTIILLDHYESNGEYFKRVKIPIDIQVPGVQHAQILRYVWTYIGLRSYWQNILPSCQLCELQESKSHSYRYYSYKYAYEKEKPAKELIKE